MSGQLGYIYLVVLGVPKHLQQGTQSAVAHKWEAWLHNPCHPRAPKCFKAADKISSGTQVSSLAT